MALAVANYFAQDPEGRQYIQGVVVMAPVTLHWENVPAEYKDTYKSYEENAQNVPIIDAATMKTFFGEIRRCSLI